MSNIRSIVAFLVMLLALSGCQSGIGRQPTTSADQTTNQAANQAAAPGATTPAPPKANEASAAAPWQKDCGALVQALTNLAPKAAGDSSGSYGDQFKHKEVRWRLKLKQSEKDNKGEDSLLFDLEPYGIRYKFFSGKPVMMGFKPAPDTAQAWKAIAPGAQVRVTATVSEVFFATMTPGDNPGKQVPTAIVSLANVKIVED